MFGTARCCLAKGNRPAERQPFHDSGMRQSKDYDPPANLRLLQANGPGFHYQAKMLQELVHGKRKSGGQARMTDRNARRV